MMVGKNLSHDKILEELGRGGMGYVDDYVILNGWQDYAASLESE